MATAKYATKPDAPAPEGPIEAWTPDAGMTISTVRMSRAQVIDVQFEHPEDWTEAQVTAAIVADGLSIGPKLEWWCADQDNIKMQSVSLGEPLTGDDARREPIALTAGRWKYTNALNSSFGG